MIDHRDDAIPTRRQALVFLAKVQALRTRRAFAELGRSVPKLRPGNEGSFPLVLAESRTPLWSESSAAEQRLQLGKVHNLRLVARLFDRLVIPEGGVFSFWRQVGRPGSGRGFVQGRQIQEGCVIPATAGGICQLSNALYDVALRAGLEIVERHAHTRSLPRSSAAFGRDATVAWNYVDLRFRSAQETMVRATLTDDELVVQLRGTVPVVFSRSPVAQLTQAPVAESCETCGMVECFQHRRFHSTNIEPRKAFLVDQVWPEFAAFLESSADEHDVLCAPVDGARLRIDRYAWPTARFEEVREARLLTAKRSWSSRRLAEQGAARQNANLDFDQRLARHFSRLVPFDVRHVVVQQTMLPFLWRDGFLGGRTFDVLMVRPPMHTLQKRLDDQLEKHPDRVLLGDFRAPDSLVRDEEDALARASRIITPHAEIASSFGERAVLLEWKLPNARGVRRGDRIAFPGPTVARKGAHEVREVARKLGFTVVAVGSELEGALFWDGVDMVKPEGDWLDGCRAVVQPAVLETRPSRLLRAIAEGVPVIATEACGLGDVPGVITIPAGDASALQEAIGKLQV